MSIVPEDMAVFKVILPKGKDNLHHRRKIKIMVGDKRIPARDFDFMQTLKGFKLVIEIDPQFVEVLIEGEEE